MRLTPSKLDMFSPGKRVRAEVGVETVWFGATVYPDSPVWRVWFGGRPVLDTSALGLAPRTGAPLPCGMRVVKLSRHRVPTELGTGREARVRFAARDGRELEALVRVTDMSASCAVSSLSAKKARRLGGTLALQCQPETWMGSVPVSGDDSEWQDLSVMRFPEGSVLWGEEETLNAQRSTLNAQPSMLVTEAEGPQVRFVPSGKVVANWRIGTWRHLVFFDRPGDLAERRFGVSDDLDGLDVPDGRSGIDLLFKKIPFLRGRLPAPVFGDGVTPAYRAAFDLAAGAGSACDDFVVMRGEPGQFMVAARRCGGAWTVGGITAEPRVLTVRFEDLWMRTPEDLRALKYAVRIMRDPLPGEAGAVVTETFEGQSPDVRAALDLARDGGFLLEFRCESGSV